MRRWGGRRWMGRRWSGRRWAARKLVWFVLGVIGLVVVIVWVGQHV
jgi:hypothetical protein